MISVISLMALEMVKLKKKVLGNAKERTLFIMYY